MTAQHRSVAPMFSSAQTKFRQARDGSAWRALARFNRLVKAQERSEVDVEHK
jgi:hypothetical protein